MTGGMITFKATVFINEREMHAEEKEAQKKDGRLSVDTARSIVQRTLAEVFTIESITIGVTHNDD